MSRTVVQSPHPRGAAGIGRSADLIRQQVLKDRKDPALRAWAIGVLRGAGHHIHTERDRYDALLAAVRQRAIYVPDPKDCEFIASAATTLCLRGDGDGQGGEGSFCFRGGDCDDLVVALLGACLAVNLTCALIIQRFKSTAHVLAGVHTESGWQRADPSYFGKVGQAYEPLSEKWIDIMTGTDLCTGSPTCVPDHVASGATLVNARPRGDFVGVGATGDTQAVAVQIVAAWGEPLKTAAVDLVAAVQRANSAARSLEDARLVTAGTGAAPDNEQRTMSTLNNLARQLQLCAVEALDGKRLVAWDAQANDLSIEGKDSDPYLVRVDASGKVTLLDTHTQQPLGQVGQVVTGAAVALLTVGVLGSVAVSYAAYLGVKKIAEAFEVYQQQETYRLYSTHTTQLITSGKATPEQIEKMTAALSQLKPTTPSSQVEQSQGTWLSNLKGTAKWVALGAGALVIAGGSAWAYHEWKVA